MPAVPSDTPLPPDVREWVGRQDDADGLARAWALAALADDPRVDAGPPPDTDAAWSRLNALLDAADPADVGRVGADPVQTGLRAWQRRGRPGLAVDRPTAGPAAPVRPFPLRRAAFPAAALAALAVVALALWPRATTLTAGADALVAALPDGSEVTLAPGSELRYRRGVLGRERRASLEGQGYFDVEPSDRPFVVRTFNAEVEVLGTEFDVSAWAGAPETAVALVEGRVEVRAGSGAVTLVPGQLTRVRGAGAPTAPVDADVGAVAAWRSGGFSVVDAPLAAVAAAVEGRYGRPVELGPGVDGDRPLTLYLPTADAADAVLGDVAAYLGFRLQVGPDRYRLLPR